MILMFFNEKDKIKMEDIKNTLLQFRTLFCMVEDFKKK